MAATTNTLPPRLDLDVLIQVFSGAPPAGVACSQSTEPARLQTLPRVPSRVRHAAAEVQVRGPCPTWRRRLILAGNAPKPASSACSTTTAATNCCLAGEASSQVSQPRLTRASYISELVDHVRRVDTRIHPSPASPGDVPHDGNLAAQTKADLLKPEDDVHYEHHFAFAGDSYRYLGAESCLVKSPRLHPAKGRSPFGGNEEDEDWQLSTKESPAKQYELLELYVQTIQPVYPILDPSLRYLDRDLPPDLTPTEQFSLYMIYSISCYILPNTGKRQNADQVWNPTGRLSYHQANSIKYRALATQYFTDAMEHLEAATVEPTIATLRSVLLLAINSSFDPKTGNIGQQVALAGRLAFDLESKRELQELEPNDVEMLRTMHMTIFSLENQVASTLDRPALFPEPVCC